MTLKDDYLSHAIQSEGQAGGDGLVKVEENLIFPLPIRKIHEIDYYNIIYFSLRITDGKTKLGGKKSH